MTREEAINILEEVKELDDSIYQYNTKYLKALDVAIKALEQQSMPTLVLPDVDKEVESYWQMLKHPVMKHIMDETIENLPSVKQEPCEDTISRQAAIDAANKVIERDTSGNNDVVNAMIAWSAYIKSLPSVKPQTGYWILKIEDWCKWTCSKCGHTERTDIHVSLGYDFCPKCGAKMLEEPTGSESEG